MPTWWGRGATSAIRDVPMLERSEGVYLFDSDGNKYMDWTSQAICTNLGYSVPPAVMQAVTEQLERLPHGVRRAGDGRDPLRFAKLMAEIMPGDLNGFLFPSGGAEANEAAVRIARRYTGRHKIISLYRSYHGGTANTLGATGDFRRFFAEDGVGGFVKAFNPTPLGFSWGGTPEEAAEQALAALEEQIVMEGPNNVAAIMIESIVGSGGTLLKPPGYMQGVRALCDKYGIVYIADEVMVGFGRTGKLWGFEHYEGVVPDIVTSAKGLSAAYLPLSVVGMNAKIQQFFVDNPLGWGATYQGHPVAMACAYECIKHMIQHDLIGNAARLESVMIEVTPAARACGLGVGNVAPPRVGVGCTAAPGKGTPRRHDRRSSALPPPVRRRARAADRSPPVVQGKARDRPLWRDRPLRPRRAAHAAAQRPSTRRGGAVQEGAARRGHLRLHPAAVPAHGPRARRHGGGAARRLRSGRPRARHARPRPRLLRARLEGRSRRYPAPHTRIQLRYSMIGGWSGQGAPISFTFVVPTPGKWDRVATGVIRENRERDRVP